MTSLIIAALFIVFDVLTGWLKALTTKTFTSSIMRSGLYHKISEFLAIGLAYLCDYTLPKIGVSIPIPFVGCIVTYLVVMEIASITENLSAINPDISDTLKKVFKNGELNDTIKKDEPTDSN